ncbi:MAG: PEP-CTERM-box response regulator transcription factor [Nitrospira sp.]|nr:PEP-CTERM-box response regulator transcription factor [Nitrospira sp.]
MTGHPLPLLLVDDDDTIREQMKWALASDYQVVEAADRPTALQKVQQVMPRLVLLDLGLPPDVDGATEGMALLREILQITPSTKVIVITGNSDRARAIEAIQSGAYDFIEKPVQLDILKVVLQRALYLANLEEEHRLLQETTESDHFEGLIGESPFMRELIQTIKRIGPSEVPVLITGESGTGKELVARAVHRQSKRAQGPFVAINCGAIPETLLESELFGYEKGAFTGAVQQRKGRIEHAQGGTLFLDEIGDIPLPLQVKLLRFLQERQVQRLGGKEPITVDVRIIAATHVDLEQAIQDGRFREDLYYRLCVVKIGMLPLSARPTDIPLLANTFLRRLAAEYQKPLVGFTTEAMTLLTSYHWPGNVRELENRIKRAVVMAEGRYVTPAHLELEELSKPQGSSLTLRRLRASQERDLVRLAMEKANGNVSRAAAELGISRPTLYQLLERYGLRKSKKE